MRTSRFQGRSEESGSSVQDWSKHSGFTLVEIVVAIAVFSLLVALLLPAASYVRKRAQYTHVAAGEADLLQNEANRYLITGKVSEGVLVSDKAGKVELRLQDQQTGFTVEVQR